MKFYCGKYFSFWMPLQNPISFIGVLRFSEYKDNFSFVYIPVNSQEMPSNTMSRALDGALHLSYVSFSDTNHLSVVWFGWQQLQQPQLLRNFMVSRFNRSL